MALGCHSCRFHDLSLISARARSTYWNISIGSDPYYQVVEVIEHIRVEVPKPPGPDDLPAKTLRLVESVTAKVINLWELANE